MANFASSWGNYLLKGIVEVTPPATMSWWPQTHAYVFVVLLIMLYLALHIVKRYQKYRRNAYRREALACLKQWSDQVLEKTANQWPALLKKTAIAAFGRDDVAALSGPQWESFLDACCQGSVFTLDAKGLLYRLSYGPHGLSPNELAVIHNQIYSWIKNHRGPYD